MEIIDANGQSRKLHYDRADRLVREEDELGQATVRAYDRAGNLVSLADANGNLTRFEHDRDGLLLRTIYPAVPGQPENLETRQYDNAGQLVCIVTPRGDFVRFRRDLAGNVAAVYQGEAAPEGEEIPVPRLIARYERDGSGALTAELDGEASLLYRYDGYGRLAEVRDSGLGKGVRYDYDPRGLRKQLQAADYAASPEGEVFLTVAYGYDNAGQLVSVRKDNDPAAQYAYDLAGRRLRLSLHNGVSSEYAYDGADRLLDLTTRKGASVLAKFSYTLDPAGNRSGIAYADGSKSLYSLDASHRLTGEQRLAADGSLLYDESFTYDAVGNRLTQTRTGWNPVSREYVYNARNQLVSSSGSDAKSYSYDLNGNLVSVSAGGGAVETLSHDVLNRQLSHSGPLGTEVVAYRGASWHRRRVTEQAAGAGAAEVLSFLYDGDDVIADYAGGELALSRLYVTPGLDQNLSLTVASGPDAGTHYYSQDGLGSVRTLADAAGAVKNNHDYSAFGEDYLSTEALPQRYGYAGRERRAMTAGGMFYRHRNYLPGEGRFDRRDPLGFTGSPQGNLYTYVNSSPHKYIDPFGLKLFILDEDPNFRKNIFEALKVICKDLIITPWNEIKINSCPGRDDPLCAGLSEIIGNKWHNTITKAKNDNNLPDAAAHARGTAYRILDPNGNGFIEAVS